MRVVNNNQGILQLFSRMNGNRANTNKPFGNAALSRRSGVGGRNTLEDLLSGHFKNSYGVEGMCVTGRSQCHLLNRNLPFKLHSEVKMLST